METRTLHLAGQGLRMVNVIIDMILFFIIWLAISFLGIRIGLDYSIVEENGETFPLFPLITLIPVFWGYYILMEFFLQKTVGKFITGTKVVNKKGSNASLKQIILRTISRSIPFEYISFLATRAGVHDLLSGTRVVKN